jgi:GTP cyclohydrolase II
MSSQGPRVPHLTVEEIAQRYGMPIGEVQKSFDRAKLAMTPTAKTIKVVEDNQQFELIVTRLGVGTLLTPHGCFWLYSIYINDRWEKYSVLVKSEELDSQLMPIFANTQELVMRTDSGCETGQLFHDATCECREQLHLAMHEIHIVGEGIIINIPRQDGRGKGLSFKLATLMLQVDLGVNTVESASMLAEEGDIDVRTYAGVVAILKFFGIPQTTLINLATNNPYKSHILLENGYQLASFRPMVIPPTEHTRRHLQAKYDHLGHKKNAGEEPASN